MRGRRRPRAWSFPTWSVLLGLAALGAWLAWRPALHAAGPRALRSPSGAVVTRRLHAFAPLPEPVPASAVRPAQEPARPEGRARAHEASEPRPAEVVSAPGPAAQ